MNNHLLYLEPVSVSSRNYGICLDLLLYVSMTSCHFRLAGGPLSVMIYWFSSLLLWLDFSFSSSLLLFSPHHRLERRWGEQLQPARSFKKKPKNQKEPEKERKVGGWAGRRSFPLLTACCTVDSSSLKKNLFEKSFQLLFSSVINILRISKWRDSHTGVTRNTQAKKDKH